MCIISERFHGKSMKPSRALLRERARDLDACSHPKAQHAHGLHHVLHQEPVNGVPSPESPDSVCRGSLPRCAGPSVRSIATNPYRS